MNPTYSHENKFNRNKSVSCDHYINDRLTFAGLGVSPSPDAGFTANAEATQVVMVSGTGTLREVVPSGL